MKGTRSGAGGATLAPCPPFVLERLRAFWCQVRSAVAAVFVEGPNALLRSDRHDSQDGRLLCCMLYKEQNGKPACTRSEKREGRAMGILVL